MKLRLEATPEELRTKGGALLKALAAELAFEAPDLSLALQKAAGGKEPERDNLKWNVLKGLYDHTTSSYKSMTDDMLKDIEVVLKKPEALGKSFTPLVPDSVILPNGRRIEGDELRELGEAYGELMKGDPTPMVQRAVALAMEMAKAEPQYDPDTGTPVDPDIDEETGDPIIDPKTGETPSEQAEAKESGTDEPEEPEEEPAEKSTQPAPQRKAVRETPDPTEPLRLFKALVEKHGNEAATRLVLRGGEDLDKAVETLNDNGPWDYPGGADAEDHKNATVGDDPGEGDDDEPEPKSEESSSDEE